MQSSQALAQTVFGTFFVLDRLPLLSAVKTDDGQPAFGRVVCETTAEFEKCVRTLGEPRPTSIDVWLNGPYRVAIECKLSESNFGTCSRTRLTANDTRFAKQYCDGIYTRQRDRTLNCTLTEIGARYWDYVDGLFGWSPAAEHRPCPLSSTYQLVRNILAACVQEGGRIVLDGGHALVVYDRRNPTMMDGGTISSTLRAPSVLRRISWQSLLAQWPNDTSLHWLKNELGEKYGLHPSTELPGAGSGEAILPSQLEHTRGK
jgi:Restriction Endonuclease associating with ARP